ncbi:MAG: GNAT family N-acetyltransferase, partial [Candidatus Heimdallarchaeota archaeon]
MKSEIRSVKWYEFSKFKKSMIRNLMDDPQISDSNFLILFFMFLWFRIKAENYFYIKDGEIAGILSLGTNRGNQVFIYTIAVEPTFRKQGIGKALMDFAEERAAELNKEYLALVVMQNNKPAISLYQKYGYRIVGEGKTYLSISSDKIKTNSTSSLELRKSNSNDNDLLSILRQFILGEINTLSGKEGLEYFEEFRFQEYYHEIKKTTQKGKQFLHLIYRDDILVGFLLFSDKKHMRI